MHGVITGINHCGTIVQVWVTTDQGRRQPVHFGHRMFAHMVAARGPRRLLGCSVTVEQTDHGEAARFDDDADGR